jgi:hypothetical protein
MFPKLIRDFTDAERESIIAIYKESVKDLDIQSTFYLNLEIPLVAVVTPNRRKEHEDCVMQFTFEHNGADLFVYMIVDF